MKNRVFSKIDPHLSGCCKGMLKNMGIVYNISLLYTIKIIILKGDINET